jgi:hypothetical protein
MQSCCFGFEQHRGRWAVFSATFYHAERAPRVISSLTAELPTIRSFKTSLVSIQGFSPPVSCAQGRLVKRILPAEAHPMDLRIGLPEPWRKISGPLVCSRVCYRSLLCVRTVLLDCCDRFRPPTRFCFLLVPFNRNPPSVSAQRVLYVRSRCPYYQLSFLRRVDQLVARISNIPAL